jgi:probable rRNA maturation factor
MTYAIDIQNDVPYLIDAKRLQLAVITVLNQHEVDPTSALTIVFTDNDAIHKLNQEHRQIDAPTDILSFPADALPDYITDVSPYLGDLIIAYPYASLQAKNHHHQLSDSLCLLVIHGTLHLLGYDHDTPKSRAEMWSAQADSLRTMGIDTAIVPALEGSLND